MKYAHILLGQHTLGHHDHNTLTSIKSQLYSGSPHNTVTWLLLYIGLHGHVHPITRASMHTHTQHMDWHESFPSAWAGMDTFAQHTGWYTTCTQHTGWHGIYTQHMG